MKARILTFVLATTGTLLSGCEREGGQKDCVPYTTSEEQRRQDTVARAAHAKERYDKAVLEYEYVDDLAKQGDNRMVSLAENHRRLLERLKGDLDTGNAELDRVNNEAPLCGDKPITDGRR